MFFIQLHRLFGPDRAGMGGLCVVLAAGLLAMMLAVRVPREANYTCPTIYFAKMGLCLQHPDRRRRPDRDLFR